VQAAGVAVQDGRWGKRGLGWVGACALVCAAGCYSGLQGKDAGSGADGADGGVDDGVDDGADDGDGDGGEDVDPETLDRVPESGLRRLTAAEYDATVRDLLGIDVVAALLLPEDWRQPFDNDYTTQVASQALVEGAELLAADVAALALETPAVRDATVGCTPTGPADDACFRTFVTTFGRRALRRPLTAEEVDRFASLLAEAQETGEFDDAVEVALRAFLQHPEFLYRVEVGTPVDDEPGVFRLGDHEIGTRLSYFIWGSTPSDALLDMADAGELHTPDQIAAAAEEMLTDDRARERIGRFHALWLGYEQLPHSPDLVAAMQAETQALIDKVIFEEATPWQDLLRASETFVDATLAEHYGLTAPGTDAGWVAYGDSGRRGLLSHGTFLSSMAKIGDSSPTKRGILVRTRLMCQVIPPPPPNVDVDNVEPPEGMCKDEFYRTFHAQGSCAGCHNLMDPIGLGLENYDHTGAFRTQEIADPSCEISGQGEIDGTPFSGPAELSALLLESGTLNECVATQLYRFAMGRTELTEVDYRFVEGVVGEVAPEGDFDFTQMVVRFVSDDAFRFRREEASAEGGE
jgi:hypothetical protein